MRTRILGVWLSAAFVAAIGFVTSGTAEANDGRDRYRLLYPNLFVHLNAPVADGAGFRVLPEDMPGGSDGDPSYRWAQSHAVAVVQVAAYETVKALGPGPFNMPIFDFSSENGDTPVDFGKPAKPGDKAKPQAPSGRHPGGSHDGGLNLDLGYYMTDLAGKVMKEDYAACTDHYHATEKTEEGQPRDMYMCTGPADRLDVDRQAYFFLRLLDMHRNRFGGRLLEEVGVDREVLRAVRGKLVAWVRDKQHGVKPSHIVDLDTIMTHDRWGGWQRFHHHHIHLRIQGFNPYGALRAQVRRIEMEARRIRARIMAAAHPEWLAVLDAQLISYRLGRSVEVHVARSPARSDRVTSVRYRMDGGAWQEPDDPRDDFRYMFDLEPQLRDKEAWVTIVAEVTTDSGETASLGARVLLPKVDPRIYVAHAPGDITGSATVRRGVVTARVAFPDKLRPLVTSATYLIHSQGGGKPEEHVVDAAWFTARRKAKAPAGGTRRSSAKTGLALKLVRDKAAPPVRLIEARVMLSSRYSVPLTLYVATP